MRKRPPGEPLPDQQEPVDPLNVITWDAADFVLCYKVRCFFSLFGPDAAAHLYV